jgi:serine phosphatase RsbU (regulator of sigma subunit)
MDTQIKKDRSEQLVCWKVWGGNERTHRDLSIPGFDGSLYSNPYKSKVGGDLYYMSACGSGAISRMCLADVSGHGESMAPVSQWFESAFSKQIHLENSSQVLKAVNAKAVSHAFSGFSTAICASYNSLNGLFQFSYAGHPPIRICRNGSEHWEELICDTPNSNGHWNLPLGVSPETKFSVGETTLRPGDRIALFTDGLIEARNANGDMLGDAIWESTLRSETVSMQAATFLQTVEGHVGDNREMDDDLTLILLDAKAYQEGNKYTLLFKNNVWDKIVKLFGRSNQSIVTH